MPDPLSHPAIAEIVASYGLDYAIQQHVKADDIADPELADLWRAAKASLDRIEEMLPEVDWEDEVFEDVDGGTHGGDVLVDPSLAHSDIDVAHGPETDNLAGGFGDVDGGPAL